MKCVYTLAALFLFFLSANSLQAQEEEPRGCHQTKQRVYCEPLTPAQKTQVRASKQRSDTLDVLNYNIILDVTDFAGKKIKGHCIVRLTPKMENVDLVNLDLEGLTVDSVLMGGVPVAFTHSGPLLSVPLATAANPGDILEVDVYYRGTPITSASGFGGFYFEDNIAYNLGIGLNDSPHNYGRAWFPCFDNFVERATYEYTITSLPGMRAYCIGTFLDETVAPDNKITRRYRMDQLLPTYLTGIAVGAYTAYDYVYDALEGPIPVQLVGKAADMANFKQSFAQLGDAIDVFEKWYGPYIWERVGYVLTTRGAMEHSTNIAYPASSVSNGKADNKLMAHELCHHWWGNMVTLETQADMWIKEGNAEYGAHLFTEYTEGKDAFVNQVQGNNQRVMRSAHIDDKAYLPLSPMPQETTYGTTTYYKGAAMIHNMRCYLGDSLFAKGQRKMLNDNLYKNLNAQTYRDQMTAATGVDMKPYFDNWVLNKGWADYEIDSFHAVAAGGQWQVETFIQQKLYGTDKLHVHDPVWVRFFKADRSYEDVKLWAEGEFTTAGTTLSFEPVMAVVNPDNRLNMASFSTGGEIYEGQVINTSVARMPLEFVTIVDTSLLYMEHHWTAPDPIKNNPDDLYISTTSYWKLSGYVAPGTRIRSTFEYSKYLPLDAELLQHSEDSLLLLYRPDNRSEWSEFPHYSLVKLNPNDGKGFMKMDYIIPGEYALGKGKHTISAVEDEVASQSLQLFPNPASEELYVGGIDASLGQWQYQVFNLQGQVLQQGALDNTKGNPAIGVSKLQQGSYILLVRDLRSGKQRTAQFIIQR